MRKALTLALRATAEALVVCGMCAGLFGCVLMSAGWPFPLPPTCKVAGTYFGDGDGGEDWAEITEDVAGQMRDCVPAIFCPHGFFVGEESATVIRDGCSVHNLVVEVSGRWFIRDCRRERASREHHYLALMHALYGEPA